MQVLALGEGVLQPLRGRFSCLSTYCLLLHTSTRGQAGQFPCPTSGCRSRPFVRVALLLAISWTWHYITSLALCHICASLPEPARVYSALALPTPRNLQLAMQLGDAGH
jgi:hypothetical protein